MFAIELIEQLRDMEEMPSDAELGEVGEEEKVMGELSVDCRRLHAVMTNMIASHGELKAKCMHLTVDAMHSRDRSRARQELSNLQSRYLLQKTQTEAAIELFWASVKTEFPETADKNIGLRKGWKVVTSEPEPERNLGSLFERILSL